MSDVTLVAAGPTPFQLLVAVRDPATATSRTPTGSAAATSSTPPDSALNRHDLLRGWETPTFTHRHFSKPTRDGTRRDRGFTRWTPRHGLMPPSSGRATPFRATPVSSRGASMAASPPNDDETAREYDTPRVT